MKLKHFKNFLHFWGSCYFLWLFTPHSVFLQLCIPSSLLLFSSAAILIRFCVGAGGINFDSLLLNALLNAFCVSCWRRPCWWAAVTMNACLFCLDHCILDKPPEKDEPNHFLRMDKHTCCERTVQDRGLGSEKYLRSQDPTMWIHAERMGSVLCLTAISRQTFGVIKRVSWKTVVKNWSSNCAELFSF